MAKSTKRTFLSNLFWFLSGVASGIAVTKWIMPPGQENLPERKDDKDIASSETLGAFVDPYVDNTVYQRVIDIKDAEIAQLQGQNSQMSSEYRRLQEKYDQSVAETQDKERVALFRALEPTLMQLNILAADLQSGTDVPSTITLSLIQKLPQKLTDIGIEMPEAIGQMVSFSPEYHLPLPTQTGLIKPGDPVEVVTPGFRYNQLVLTRSEVQKGSPENG